MVPYIDIPALELGPLKLHPFGFLVGVAIIFGTWVADKRAQQTGLSRKTVSEGTLWAVVIGFLGAHLFEVLMYTPEKVLDDPLVLLRIWDGISSFGGFLGGVLGLVGYLKFKAKVPVYPYLDAIFYGFCFAWIFGRMGCTVAHDHPGLPSDFFLAVDYPASEEFPAGPRHDLGWYEFLYTVLVMAPLMYVLGRKPRFYGWVTAFLAVMYMPVRFVMDTLRTADVRWFSTDSFEGLTPGQLAAVALFIVGIAMFIRRPKQPGILTPDYVIHTYPDGRKAWEEPKTPASGGRSGGAKTTAGKKSKNKKAKAR